MVVSDLGLTSNVNLSLHEDSPNLDGDPLARLDVDRRVDGPEAPGADHRQVGVLRPSRLTAAARGGGRDVTP